MIRIAPFACFMMAACLILGTLGGGCSNPDPDTAPPANQGGEPASARIDVPLSIRENLGITFARVERRPVRKTLRAPGEFELRPDAIREHRVALSGEVRLEVRQFDEVQTGHLLATLESPDWTRIRHEAVEAEGEIRLAEAALHVAEAVKREAEQSADLIRARLAALASANVRNVQLEAELAATVGRMDRLDAERNAREVELDEAREHYASTLTTLASLADRSVEQLTTIGSETGVPEWRTIDLIEMRADAPGIVDEISVTDGGWVEPGELVLTVVNPAAIRFRAFAPQADLAILADGQEAAIVPPLGGSIDETDAIPGELHIGFEARADDRTVPLFVVPDRPANWAKPGVTAFLEVYTGGSDDMELAIPLACVVREELAPIYFRRDPEKPDVVIRVDADLGVDDGRWIVVRSGVKEGDEIVLDGAYALKLSGGSRQAPPGYHYHADGTLHKNHD